MRTLISLVVLSFLVLGFGNALSAYEGGTKAVATMTHPEKGEAQFGPVLLVPHSSLTPSKAVTSLIHGIPQPTLTMSGIREEEGGQTLGTKAVVRFWKGNRA